MKKKIISLILVLIFVLSLASCFKDERKYDYKDMSKYVVLKPITGLVIDLEEDTIQKAMLSQIVNFATTSYKAKKGDDIYVNLKYTEVEFLDVDKKNYDKKSEITTLAKNNFLIKNLGVDNEYSAGIEDIIVKMNIELLKKVDKIITIPNEPDTFGEHAGKEVLLTCEFANKRCVEGDVVEVNYTGYYLDDKGNIKVDSNGKKETFDSGKKTLFYLGSGLAIDDFEKGIIGMRLNETVESNRFITATFPSDYGVEQLNGKKVKFEVTVTGIREHDEFNDEFVKKNLDFETVEEYRQDYITSYAKSKMNEHVLEQAEIIKYPKREYRELKDDFNELELYYMSYYGISFEAYVKQLYGMDKDTYIKESMKPEMIYYAIAQQQNIEPSKDDIAKARLELINENKDIYLQNYTSMTEADALTAATEYVDTQLTTSDIYEKALYTKVEAYIYSPSNYTVNIIEKK